MPIRGQFTDNFLGDVKSLRLTMAFVNVFSGVACAVARLTLLRSRVGCLNYSFTFAQILNAYY